MMRPFLTLLFLIGAMVSGWACDLCSIYNVYDNGYKTGTGGKDKFNGFLFSISELFVPFRTEQLDGDEISSADPDYLDSSITHLVPTYNFSATFGVSLNVPLIHRNFKRKSVVVGANRQ